MIIKSADTTGVGHTRRSSKLWAACASHSYGLGVHLGRSKNMYVPEASDVVVPYALYFFSHVWLRYLHRLSILFM